MSFFYFRLIVTILPTTHPIIEIEIRYFMYQELLFKNLKRQAMDDLYNPKEPLIIRLRSVIRFAVRVLAVIMTGVILLAVGDVGWVLYRKLVSPPFLMLTISDILATFGAFMAVLIAIEIFVNITIYLRDDVIHVKIVMATALMAIARKIIILDFDKISPDYVWAIAGVVFSMSIGYFLIVKFIKDDEKEQDIKAPHSMASPDIKEKEKK